MYKGHERRVVFSFLRPVGLRELFDRDAELEALAGSGRGAAISGPRGIGKSSLLKSLKDLIKSEGVLIIYAGLNGSPASSILGALEGLAGSGPDEGPQELAERVREASGSRGTTPVLLMDEWLSARKGAGYERYRRLVYYLVKLGGARAFLASSEIGLSDEALKDPELPLGNYIKPMKLAPFDLETSVEFLYEGLRGYGASCGKRSIEEAYYVSEGFPVWLNLIGIRMVEGMCNPRGVLTDNRAQRLVVSTLLSLGQKQREMIRAIALGRRFTEVGPHSRRVLLSLIREGYVICNGNCSVVDPVMNEMLRLGVV